MGKKLKDCEFVIQINKHMLDKLDVQWPEIVHLFKLMAEDVEESVWAANAAIVASNARDNADEPLDCWIIDSYLPHTKVTHQIEAVPVSGRRVWFVITGDPDTVPDGKNSPVFNIFYPDVLKNAPPRSEYARRLQPTYN